MTKSSVLSKLRITKERLPKCCIYMRECTKGTHGDDIVPFLILPVKICQWDSQCPTAVEEQWPKLKMFLYDLYLCSQNISKSQWPDEYEKECFGHWSLASGFGADFMIACRQVSTLEWPFPTIAATPVGSGSEKVSIGLALGSTGRLAECSPYW